MPFVDQKIAGSIVRWRGLFALLALGTCCAGCCTSGPILSASQPNVVIFRAIGGYFPYISDLEDQMLDEGVCPTVAFPEAHQKVTERITAARNMGRLNGPLVIVGYSAGADKALLVSRKLGERGITVDKLVLLEASAYGRVPGNVRECVNIYKPQPWTEYFPFFRGCTVAADSPATQLVNYNLREFNDGRYDWDNHFTVTFNPYVRDLMMDEVLSGIEEVPEQDEMLSALEEGDGLSVAEEIPASMN